MVLVLAAGYYRRGDLAAGLMPATYFVHGLAGYAPTVMSAHSLPTFLSPTVDPLAYATIPAYAAAQTAAAHLHGSVYDSSNVGGSDATTTSELSPASTQNGIIDTNGPGNYTPTGYGHCRFQVIISFSLWCAFSAMTVSVGWQEGYPFFKKS